MGRLFAAVRSTLASIRDRLAIDLNIGVARALLIDRGRGMIYDVERNITWLQDANYARTTGRSADGQLTWQDAMQWAASLDYRGIRGWRLPDARAANGSGPVASTPNFDGEIGHLFTIDSSRRAPATLNFTNFDTNRIYWYRNEASPTDAFAIKIFNVRQGPLAKNPWQDPILRPLEPVLAWPVHDGDVGRNALSRFVARITSPFLQRAR